MKKTLILLCLLISGSSLIHAQKYFSKTGVISFFSSTPMEDIEAVSNSASTVFDLESGKIQWAVLIKSFEFEKALMQEHFNENYMESSKFPKATFKGSFASNEINMSEKGNYEVDVNGELTIHGVTQKINTKASFTITEQGTLATSTLLVQVADYGIEIPAVVRENIAKEIKIEIKADYALMEKS